MGGSGNIKISVRCNHNLAIRQGFHHDDIPYRVTSDNGPSFNGIDIKHFLNDLDVKHRRITPYWPQANSSAENFNRCLRKIIQTARIEKKGWKQQVYRFLRNYRATPRPSTGKFPAELMFPGRSYRTKLPEIRISPDDHEVREKDRSSKEKMKAAADKNRNVSVSISHRRYCINETAEAKQAHESFQSNSLQGCSKERIHDNRQMKYRK